jgi:YbbR domain-containing protein
VPERVSIYGRKSQIGHINIVNAAKDIDLADIEQSITIRIPLEKRMEILKFEDTEEVEVILVVENKNEQDKEK